jgi:hypothetical protein
MIDLNRTEEQMLSEIRSGGAAETRFAMRGHTPDEMLPGLMDAFTKRYAFVPSERVFGELNYLVKKGLGNAYKWGNDSNADRPLKVRAVMTDAGAVIAITDEGRGFDVASVLQRFFQNDGYSRHGGSGFDHFQESRSIVSWRDGGRTLLIQFLCSSQPDAAGSRSSARPSRAETRQIDLSQIVCGSQVKIKGSFRPDGRFVAEKVGLKGDEKWGVIDGVIRGVHHCLREIDVLNARVRLPENTEIASPEQRRLGFDALSPGQIVELIGSYSPELGLVPMKIQIRHDSEPDCEEVQGKIDSVSETDATFSVLGITVYTDEHTKFKDKRT